MNNKIRNFRNKLALFKDVAGGNKDKNIIYLGYVGRRNFGDDLLLEIYRKIRGRTVIPMLDYFRFGPSIKGEVVLGGGTVIGGNLYLQSGKQLLRPPSIVFCAGVIGETVSREWGDYLRDAQIFTRSKESAAKLEQIGLTATPWVDPAIYCSKIFQEPTAEGETSLVLAPHGEHANYTGYAAIVESAGHRKKIIWLASSPDDEATCRRFAKAWGGKVILGWRDIQETVSVIARCGQLVSTRLHPAICAASFKRPFLLISYSDKHREFVNSIGLPEQLVFADGVQDMVDKLNLRDLDWGGVDAWLRRFDEFRAIFKGSR